MQAEDPDTTLGKIFVIGGNTCCFTDLLKKC